LLSPSTAAPQDSQPAPAPDELSSLVGDWHGDSSCVAKNTACRDESVVYHIAKLGDKPNYVSVAADKIVGGKAVNMGVLAFLYRPDQHTLICEYSQGVWRLKVHDGTMEGTLTQADHTVFRRVTLRRQP
jgi:hypothetical protein